MKDEFPENSLLDVIDNTTCAFAWGRSAPDQEDTNNIKRSTEFRKEAHPSVKDLFFVFLTFKHVVFIFTQKSKQKSEITADHWYVMRTIL